MRGRERGVVRPNRHRREAEERGCRGRRQCARNRHSATVDAAYNARGRARRIAPPSARHVPPSLLHEAAALCTAAAAVAVTVPPPPLLLQGLHTFLREQGRNSRQLATTTSSRTAYTVN